MRVSGRDARIGHWGVRSWRFARRGTYRAVLKVHRGVLVQGSHARVVYGGRTRPIDDLQRPEPVVHLGMDLHRGSAFASNAMRPKWVNGLERTRDGPAKETREASNASATQLTTRRVR